MQGTINGYGERTGNCNLTTIIPNLTLKMGIATLPEGRLERLTAVSHHIAELVNRHSEPAGALRRLVGVRPQGRPARVGHRQAAKDAYEHIDPETVGNGTRFVVSELAGTATIEIKAEELGLDLDGAAARRRRSTS